MWWEAKESQVSARGGRPASGSFPAAAPSTGTGCISCSGVGTCSSSREGLFPPLLHPPPPSFVPGNAVWMAQASHFCQSKHFPQAYAKEVLGTQIFFFLLSKYTEDRDLGRQPFTPVLSPAQNLFVLLEPWYHLQLMREAFRDPNCQLVKEQFRFLKLRRSSLCLNLLFYILHVSYGC